MIRVGIDIGGTFTDFAVWRSGDDSEKLFTHKIPSTPENYAHAFKAGMETILDLLSPDADEEIMVVHGTTVSTNQVIERSGPVIALLVTEGFQDILNIQRLRLRNPLNIFERRTKALIPRNLVFETPERMLHDGKVARALDRDAVLANVQAALDAGAVGIAIAFHHSYRNPAHEEEAKAAIKEAYPDLNVTMSSEIWPKIGEYERAVVAVLNSYVKDRMFSYIRDIDEYLAKRLRNYKLFITRSNGGAMSAAEAMTYPVHTLLSGPASGVTAAQFIGRERLDRKIVTLDMGGTSTDISLIQDGQPTVANNAEVGDFPLMMPVTGIEAIGAGGGSIAWLDGKLLRVGPQSAGANPGPACFGKGGKLPTLTDAYVLAGYLNVDNFLGGRMKLDRAAAEAAMQPIAAAIGSDLAGAAEACIAVATSNMVAKLLPFLARYGVDPEDVTLVLFGGAGALQGPLLAREVGIRRLLVPATPSVFCAYGGLVTELVHDTVAVVQGRQLGGSELMSEYAALADLARSWLEAQLPGGLLMGTVLEYRAQVAYVGQSFQIDVEVPEHAAHAGDLNVLESAFHREHERLYGHSDPKAPIYMTELRVRIRGRMPMPVGDIAPFSLQAANAEHIREASAARGGIQDSYWGDGAQISTRLVPHAQLVPEAFLEGPAIIDHDDSTILVPPGYFAVSEASGAVVVSSEDR